MLISLLFEGVYQPGDRTRHLRALRGRQPNQEDMFEHDYLYNCLSILDSKAQALLSYVGILTAAGSISLSIFPREIQAGSILVFASLVASTVSAALCLTVIWVHWTDTLTLESTNELFVKLLEIRGRRTIGYRLAWVIAQFATLFLLSGILSERRFS